MQGNALLVGSPYYNLGTENVKASGLDTITQANHIRLPKCMKKRKAGLYSL